jgi:hypothetical protein
MLGCDSVDERQAQEPPKHWPEAFALNCQTPFGRGWPPGFQTSIDLKRGRYSGDYPRIGDGNIVRVDGPIIVLAEWTIPKGLDNNPEHFTVSFDRQTEILTRIHEYSAFIPGRDVQTSQCEVRPLRPLSPSADTQTSVAANSR